MQGGLKPVRMLIPTQLPVGTVNSYLLPGPENVLIDTGPRHSESRGWLDKGFKRVGLRVNDLDVILITHGHVDHYGQAGDLSEASGAEIWVPEVEKETIADFSQAYDDRGEFYRQTFLRTGIPEETLALVADFFDYVKTLAAEAPVHKTFREGETLSFTGWELEVLHTPGHSPGSSCFTDGKALFAGDTILPYITPNAAFGGADGRSVGMADYLTSLERLEKLDPEHIYPGHGPPMDALKPFIKNYRALYKTRREAILRLLRQKPQNAFDLVNHLLGALPIQEVFLGITEVLGHLEILQREGMILSEERDGVDYYSLREARLK